MFDKYQIGRTVTQYVPYEKEVNEHRAPTDESIKLYEEIKEKAYDSILNSISINNNTINLSAIVCKDPCDYKTFVRYKLRVNDAEMIGEVKLKQDFTFDKTEIIKNIFEDLSKSLVENLLKNLLMDSVNKIVLH